MAPFWEPKYIKINLKIDPERHHNNDRFWDRFFGHLGSILKPKLGPCKLHFRLKWRDVLARRPIFCCLGSFFLLFRRFDSNLAPFGLHLSGSGTRLGSIWKVFGPIMVPSWRYLGPETEREIAREREERNIRKRKIEREREKDEEKGRKIEIAT